MRKLSLGLLAFVLALSFAVVPALAYDASIYYLSGSSSELKVEDDLTLGADTTTGFGAEVDIPIAGAFGARVSYLDLNLEDYTVSENAFANIADNVDDVFARKLDATFTYNMDLSGARLQLLAGWAKVEAGINLVEPAWYSDDTTGYTIEGNGLELGARADIPLTDRLSASFGASWMPSFDMEGSLSDDAECWSLESCSATEATAILKYAFSDNCNAFLGYKHFCFEGDPAAVETETPGVEATVTSLPLMTSSPEFTTSGFFAGVGFVF